MVLQSAAKPTPILVEQGDQYNGYFKSTSNEVTKRRNKKSEGLGQI